MRAQHEAQHPLVRSRHGRVRQHLAAVAVAAALIAFGGSACTAQANGEPVGSTAPTAGQQDTTSTRATGPATEPAGSQGAGGSAAPSSTGESTASAATRPTSGASDQAPGSDGVVSIGLDDLERGDSPTVATMQRGELVRVNRHRDRLFPRSDHRRGVYLAVDSGIFTATFAPESGDLYYQPTLFADHGTGGSAGITGRNFVPGPDGSVMWIDAATTRDTLVIGRIGPQLDKTSYRIPVDLPKPREVAFVAAADSVFVEVDGSVTRYGLQPDGAVSDGEPVGGDGRLEVYTADPQTNLVALRQVPTDGDGNATGGSSSSYLVDADDPTKTWQTGEDSIIRALSPDGRYAFAFSGGAAGGKGTVYDRQGNAVLELDGVFSGQAAFDPQNRLNLIGVGDFNDEGPQVAMVRCDLSGECQQTSDRYRYRLADGSSPLAVVGWSSAHGL